MTGLPSVDDVLGPEQSQGGLPSVDDVLGPPDAVQHVDQNIAHATFNILNAFGYGIRQGFGDQPIDTPLTALSPETEKALKSAGIFNDYTKGQNSALRTIYEGTIRQGAAALELGQRVMTSAISGPLQAAGQTLEELGIVSPGSATGEEGLAGAARDPGMAMVLGPLGLLSGEAETANALRLRNLVPRGILGETAEEAHATAATAQASSELHTDLHRARAHGVIGEGEAGHLDAVPITPENMQDRVEAAKEAGEPPPKPLPPPPDVHALARRVNPPVFQERDSLIVRQNSYREWLGELQKQRAASPEIAAAENDINTILGKVNGVEERLTGKQRERLADAQARLEAAHKTQTPDEALVREKLLETEHRLWDLAPDIREAYRQATDIMPDEAAPKEMTLTEAADKEHKAAGLSDKPVETEEPPAIVQPSEEEQVRAALAKKNMRERDELNQHIDEGEATRAALKFKGGNLTEDEHAADLAAQVAGNGAITKEAAPAEHQPRQVLPVKETTGNGRMTDAEHEADIARQRAATAEGGKPSGRGGALRTIEGSGDLRTRGLSEGVEAKAIESQLTDNFGDLPEYRQLSMQEQAEKASELLAEDYDRAKAIALGQRQPPKGLLPESIFVAVEKRALAEGDVDTLSELATKSKLTAEATTMGQRLRTLGERDAASPVAAIQDVQAARAAELAKRVDLKTAKEDVAAEIKAVVRKNASPAEAWTDFINSIMCKE